MAFELLFTQQVKHFMGTCLFEGLCRNWGSVVREGCGINGAKSRNCHLHLNDMLVHEHWVVWSEFVLGDEGWVALLALQPYQRGFNLK